MLVNWIPKYKSNLLSNNHWQHVSAIKGIFRLNTTIVGNILQCHEFYGPTLFLNYMEVF